jgi:hypothetical protein
MTKEMTKLRETVKVLQKENEILREDKRKLQESYEKISLTAVKRPVNNTKMRVLFLCLL